MQQACRSWAGRWNSDGLVACLADLQACRYGQGQRRCLPLGQAPLIPNQRLRNQPHLHRGCPTKDAVCPAVAILGSQHSGTQQTVDGSLHQRNGVWHSASTPSPAMVRLRLEAVAAQLRNRRHRAGIGAGCEAARERCSRRSSRQSEPRTCPDQVVLARRHAGKSNAPPRSLPPQAENTDLPGKERLSEVIIDVTHSFMTPLEQARILITQAFSLIEKCMVWMIPGGVKSRVCMVFQPFFPAR